MILPNTVCTPFRCLVFVFAEHHEELAAAGVLAGVGHRERADFVFVRIAGRLALDLVARAARPDRAVAAGRSRDSGSPPCTTKSAITRWNFTPS